MMMSPTDGVVEKNPNGSESEDITTPKWLTSKMVGTRPTRQMA